MAYVIGDDCIACGTCQGECPVEAISEGEKAAPLFLMPAKKLKNVGSLGKNLRVTGKEPLSFYRLPIPKRSFAYTQTIVRLYANDRVPIRKLKRSQT